MRVAVVGGTGLVGRYTVEALEREGHEAVVIARSRGLTSPLGSDSTGRWPGSYRSSTLRTRRPRTLPRRGSSSVP